MREKNKKHMTYHYVIFGLIVGLPLFYVLLGCFSHLDETSVFLTNSCNLMSSMASWSINDWYVDLLDVLTIEVESNTFAFLLVYYPLYIIWIYMLHLVTDCIILLPKIFGKWLNKLDGDYNE